MRGIREAVLGEQAWGTGAEGRGVPVASRLAALKTLTGALLAGDFAPVLLTGETGAGKTWLWRRLVDQLPSGWRWMAVELTESVGPPEFLGFLRHGLGLAPVADAASARIGLAQALTDDARDGCSWLLVVENAQAASRAVWQEILALMRQMEAREGFASILIVGPTPLARQLAGRDWIAVAGRLAAHVHLLPLDLDECRELSRQQGAPGFLDEAALERLHRDAGGNPRAILQLLSRRRHPVAAPAIATERPGGPAEPGPRPRSVPTATLTSPAATSLGVSGRARLIADIAQAETLAPAPAPAPSPALASAGPGPAELIPSRPPLRVEDGLVEVGWAGNLEAEAEAAIADTDADADTHADADTDVEAARPRALAAPDPAETSGFHEEEVEDPYAALQSWNEWTANQSRTAEPSGAEESPADAAENDLAGEPEADREPSLAGRRSLTGLRAEGQHEHAPYSQLFSRLRQSS